jgi:hypothetical protein
MHQTAGVHICVSRTQGQQGALLKKVKQYHYSICLEYVDRQDAASSGGISRISFLKCLQQTERHEVECIL